MSAGKKQSIILQGKKMISKNESENGQIYKTSLGVTNDNLQFEAGSQYTTINQVQPLDRINLTDQTQEANQSSQIYTTIDGTTGGILHKIPQTAEILSPINEQILQPREDVFD